MQTVPFHLAFPVHDLEIARKFYGDLLQCPLGRSHPSWIDFNFFGHQITAHIHHSRLPEHQNAVDGMQVPVPHFGAILEWEAFHTLAARLQSEGVTFRHRPTIRFEGQVGEQATMFVEDGNGNVLEFKSFKDQSQVFAT